MRKSRGVSGIGGAAIAALLTVGATVAMQAQSARNDGITVHGHWVIDIINPDGAVASHNEFENALEATGTTALSGVLARTFTPRAWQVVLLNATGEGACVRTAAAPPPSASWWAIVPPGMEFIYSGDGNPQTFPAQGVLTPGAPVFTNVPGPSVLPAFTLGGSVNFQLSAADAEGDTFTTTVGSGAPQGFVLSSSGAPVEDIHWDTSATPPGAVQFDITLTDVGGHSNVYRVYGNVVGAVPPPDSGPVPCIAVETGTTIPTEFANAWFPTLAFAVVDDDPYHQHLEITGNVTATLAEPVTQVQSVLRMTNGVTLPFSARTLATPIQVVAGQKIYVKVVLTFN